MKISRSKLRVGKRKKGRKPSQDEEEAPHHLEFKKISLCLSSFNPPFSPNLTFGSSLPLSLSVTSSFLCRVRFHTLAPFSSCINLYHPPTSIYESIPLFRLECRYVFHSICNKFFRIGFRKMSLSILRLRSWSTLVCSPFQFLILDSPLHSTALHQNPIARVGVDLLLGLGC